MPTLLEELKALPMLRAAGPAEVTRTARYWLEERLQVNEVLWREGEATDRLAVVLSGELGAEVAGHAVGTVRAPELLGEASVFLAGSTRSATIVARRPSHLATLSIHHLETLRSMRSPLYDVMLDQALLTLTRRIRTVNARIAELVSGGVAAPARREPGALARMWRALVPGLPPDPCPPIEPLLRLQPGLSFASREEIEALTTAFQPVAMPQGEIVFLEGETGSALYIVAVGSVDVLRHVRGDRAELLATLHPSHQLGANTLVDPGPRTASCVATAPTWLYRLDRAALGALPSGARRVFRESIAAVLATQIRNANTTLRKSLRLAAAPGTKGAERAAEPAGRAPESELAGLLRASGFLEGLAVNEEELESLRFVVTEDARRNAKNGPNRR